MYSLIQQQAHLDDVIARMQQTTVYALDTEFIKVDTFRPKLGVLQLNVMDQVYLLDGAALDLSQLWPLLFQAQQTIMHACGEDVDLIHFYAQQKPIPNIFDTQIALSFLGHGLQLSYQNAIKLCLNIEIDKDQTRSDWLARPLSTEQLQYAANDVLYLPVMAQQLKHQLQLRGIYEWVLEDCHHLSHDIALDTAAHELYLDVGNFRHSAKQLMQLQQLMQWRETLVREHNIPRSFVLKNSSLMDLVEKNPRNAFQLSQIRDVRGQAVREYGKTILMLLHELPDQQQWPQRITKPLRLAPEMTAKIDELLSTLMLQTGIPTEVLMRKKWLTALVSHAQDPQVVLPRYLTGWRHSIITQPILQLLNA